ncbi:MAG: hypothetical protein NTY68_03510 [Candidatus Micrarchaeota archaeon]|nr:hypothetical protein [Candidatus Micrarchaeota archaeon]
MVEKMEIEDDRIYDKIKDYVTQGWYGKLIEMSEDAKLPESIRKAAADSVASDFMEEIRNLADRENYSEIFDKVSKGLPESLCKSAGIFIAEIYNHGHFFNISYALVHPSLPESFREAVGMKMIEELAKGLKLEVIGNHVKDEGYEELVSMSKMEGLPQSVQKAAKDALETGGMKAIKKYAEKGYYHALIEISKLQGLSEYVREVAGVELMESLAKEKYMPASVQAFLHKAFEELKTKRVARITEEDGVLSEGTINPPAAQKKAQPGLPKLKI